MPDCLPYILILGSALASHASVTENPHQTVTYNPGQDCLPYDGSVVPNCWDFVDPVTKQPVYHIHSANCSRFWECGPQGETCLFECAHCGGSSNQQCQNQWALSFDTSYQYPDGPVCDWPGNIDCTIGCPDNSECCENTDCSKCSEGFCNLDWTCTYPEDCCTSDAECGNYDGMCNVPAPHTQDNCAYCDQGQCVGGCADLGSNSANCPPTHPTCGSTHECGCSASAECDMYDGECDMTDSSDPYTGNCYYCDGAQAQCVPGCGGLASSNHNCPAGYECDLSTHECQQSLCDDHSFCDGWDQVCNPAYDNCAFCGGDCGAEDGCCQGCHDDGLNCAYPQPICNLDSNTCGCKADTDCDVADFCNPDTVTCEPKCDDHSFCDGWDQLCNTLYDNCAFCGGDCGAADGCCQGCHDDGLNCAYPQPICNLDSNTCGCQADTDCDVADFCNPDTVTCEPKCDDHSFCDGWDQLCNTLLYDNCAFCGGDCGAADGCCQGCHDDGLNCAYPQPICHQDSNTCGCQNDDHCEVTDFCNPDTDSCEVVPNECEIDKDCNKGLTGVCEAGVAEQTQCKYCTAEGHRNVCKPGCLYDSSSNDIPRCSAAAPVCNAETHICQANSGSILLTKMVFTSRSCEGCDQEGVNMTLTGTILQHPNPQCKTINLDNPTKPDFKDTSTFLSIPAQQEYGWNNCWNGPLDGMVSSAVVTWTGSGQWSPNTICYDWDKETQVVSLCTFPEGTTLAHGEQATGSCYVGDLSCP